MGIGQGVRTGASPVSYRHNFLVCFFFGGGGGGVGAGEHGHLL